MRERQRKKKEHLNQVFPDGLWWGPAVARYDQTKRAANLQRSYTVALVDTLALDKVSPQ